MACDKFIYMDIIDLVEVKELMRRLTLILNPEINIKLIKSSINDLADDNGYVYMGDLGNHLMKKQPDFDLEIMDTIN